MAEVAEIQQRENLVFNLMQTTSLDYEVAKQLLAKNGWNIGKAQQTAASGRQQLPHNAASFNLTLTLVGGQPPHNSGP
jgi:hypothetical protein